MEFWGERLKEARNDAHKTLEDIANAIGVTKSTIQRYECGGIRKPKLPVVDAIANYLGVSSTWLLGGDAPKHSQIFGASIATRHLRCASHDTEFDFTLMAKDSSMEPSIHEGDLVFIRSQPMVENGQIAAVDIDGKTMLKRVYWYRDAHILILRPDNSQMSEMVFNSESLENVKILGRAVALQRDVT